MPSCASIIFAAAMVFSLPASIAFVSRFSGGVRIRPQNTGVIAGAITESCQSIHICARARVLQIGGLERAVAVLGGEIAARSSSIPTA